MSGTAADAVIGGGVRARCSNAAPIWKSVSGEANRRDQGAEALRVEPAARSGAKPGCLAEMIRGSDRTARAQRHDTATPAAASGKNGCRTGARDRVL